ncbi:hypothetical protein V8E53_009300 [Lactarius tabidus]
MGSQRQAITVCAYMRSKEAPSLQSSAPSQRGPRDGPPIHVLRYPYALRVPLSHARVHDELVQSVQCLAPVLALVRNNRNRTDGVRDYLLKPRLAGFVICPNRADGFSWYLTPSDVPFVAFGKAQNDIMLGGHTVLPQDIYTDDVHIGVFISSV